MARKKNVDAGREAKSPVGRVMDRALGKILDGVRQSDLAQLKKTLRQMLANANKLVEP